MTRLESIRNNTFLLGLDMNRATKEQKIQMLCQMIDNETDKPEDEIDFALIGECSAYLRELSDKAAEATKEQKQRILQQIKAHHNQTATKSAKVLRPNWKTARKAVAIAIAAALLLTLTLSVIAKVKGYSSAWEYVKENIQKIIGLDAGDRVNDEGITLIKNDGVITYSSVEELWRNEKLDILYPSELPEGIQITNVSQQIISEEHIVYCYQFTEEELFVVASTKHSILQEDLLEAASFTTANMIFYIKELSNGVYQVIGYDDKYEYIVSYEDYNKLVIILNGMKGLEK
ncbi:MAG: hypothetical protein IJB94_04080 [Clostridia bacterium]|nr:hypothetical protein [Clostridia bacterium]